MSTEKSLYLLPSAYITAHYKLFTKAYLPICVSIIFFIAITFLGSSRLAIAQTVPQSLLLTDFSQEGRADVFWRHIQSGTLLAWEMNGFTISSAQTIGSVNPVWQLKGQGDLNGDGQPDLLWRHSLTGDLLVWFMNGFTVVEGVNVGRIKLVWQFQLVADVNGDGRADLVWRHRQHGNVIIWLMNGATILQPRNLGTVPLTWQLRGPADFNGDGRMDLVWRHIVGGNFLVWLFDGAGNLISNGQLPNSEEANWKIMGLGDLNADGQPDVIWRHITTGAVRLTFLFGLTPQADVNLASVPLTWQLQGLGDLNGDGRVDLLWRHGVTGALVVWLMNGVSIQSSQNIGTVATVWKLKPDPLPQRNFSFVVQGPQGGRYEAESDPTQINRLFQEMFALLRVENVLCWDQAGASSSYQFFEDRGFGPGTRFRFQPITSDAQVGQLIVHSVGVVRLNAAPSNPLQAAVITTWTGDFELLGILNSDQIQQFIGFQGNTPLFPLYRANRTGVCQLGTLPSPSLFSSP